MLKDYEFEWHANKAVNEIRQLVDLEGQFVKKEHKLWDVLHSVHHMIGHLLERIPKSEAGLTRLLAIIAEILGELTILVEEDMPRNLNIVKEDRELLQKLKKDVSHRRWKAVIYEINSLASQDDVLSRLRISELRHVHSRFMQLMRLIKGSGLIRMTKGDLTIQKPKSQYSNLVRYYLIQIYKFARAYERIFRHLWRKERILFGGLTNAYRGVTF